MTCIEKLRELHPDWDDEKVEYYVEERKFYHPEIWRAHYIARPFPTRVEFDCDEEKMLSEIARYTGYSRDFIAREAVRYMYEEWFLKERRRESGPYYKCHEPVVWMDSEESCEAGEVKMDERK